MNEEFTQYVIDLRREFHQHPEVSGQEEWTSHRIIQELSALSIPYEVVGDKNVIGRIDNGSGKRIAFRADIDALPVQEVVDVPWKSQNEGVMHACGHDAHTACLLGAAKLFTENTQTWSGTIYLCFQQGEEAGFGASECVDYLKEQGGVDAVFGVHMMSIMPPGLVNLQAGPRMNGAIVFKISISGTSGHGARPDLSVSAAEIMCDLYDQMIRIPSNHHEAAKTCVISPCVLRSGSRFNVMPETATIEGTIRFIDREDAEPLMKEISRLSKQTAALHGGSAEVDYNVVAKYPVYNDPDMTEAGRRAAEKAGFKLFDTDATSASDNFGEFLYAFPGYYCFVGSQSNRPGTTGIHHSADFDLDESVLPGVSEMFYNTVLELQTPNSPAK